MTDHDALATAPHHGRGLHWLLCQRGLRRVAVLKALGGAGDGAFQGALAGVVLFSPERHTSAAAIAAGAAVLLLPYSLIGPFAGALLDRWSRRQVLVWANLLRAVLALGTAALISVHVPEWVIFVGALSVTGASRFVGSGLSAAIPHTVPVDSLAVANSLISTIGSVSTVVGAGLALAAQAVAGSRDAQIALVVMMVAALYVAAALAARGFARDALGPDQSDEPTQTALAILLGFVGAARHIHQRRPVALAISSMVLIRACFGMATLIALLLFRHTFTGWGPLRGGPPGVTGILLIAGVGLFLGAVTTGWVAQRIGVHAYLVIVIAGCAVCVLAVASHFTELTTAITALTLAFGYQAAKICADTVIQADSDDAYIGRVFALYDTANNISYVLAFAAGVYLVPADGRGMAAVFVVAGLYLLVGLTYWLGHRIGSGRVADRQT